MRKVLDKRTIAKVEADRAKGLSVREIAAKYGISLGSVHNSSKQSAKTKPIKSSDQVVVTIGKRQSAPATAQIAQSDEAELSPEELRRFLGSQVRDLRTACETAKAEGDQGAFASASRGLTAAVQLLARLAPQEAVEEKVGLYVTHAQMEAQAESGLAKMRALVLRLRAERDQ